MAHILSLEDLDLARGTSATKILLSMFEARKSVFVDLLKWDVPILDGRYEFDQFDDDRARYVVLADGSLGHQGSARLLPSTRGHILGNLYAHLCADAVPRGTDIFEITRFCLDRGLRTKQRREVRDALVQALVDHALASGIRTYTAIAEAAWYRQIERFGWDCRPLGAPRRIGGQELQALRIDLDERTPALLAARGIGDTPDRTVPDIQASATTIRAAAADVTHVLGRVA